MTIVRPVSVYQYHPACMSVYHYRPACICLPASSGLYLSVCHCRPPSTCVSARCQEIGDGRGAVVQRHLQLLSAVCRADCSQPPLDALLPPLVDALLQSALDAAGTDPGLLSNSLLVYLGLIKVRGRAGGVQRAPADARGMRSGMGRRCVGGIRNERLV